MDAETLLALIKALGPFVRDLGPVGVLALFVFVAMRWPNLIPARTTSGADDDVIVDLLKKLDEKVSEPEFSAEQKLYLREQVVDPLIRNRAGG